MCTYRELQENTCHLQLFLPVGDYLWALFQNLLGHCHPEKHGWSRVDVFVLNSILANCNFCHPLITFENSLDPDQDQQNVGPDLDPNRLTL